MWINLIYPQVLHHLAVEIPRMGGSRENDGEPRHLAAAGITHGLHQILFGHRMHSLVEIEERVFYQLHDLFFVHQRVGSVFVRADFDGRLLPNQRRSIHIVIDTTCFTICPKFRTPLNWPAVGAEE